MWIMRFFGLDRTAKGDVSTAPIVSPGVEEPGQLVAFANESHEPEKKTDIAIDEGAVSIYGAIESGSTGPYEPTKAKGPGAVNTLSFTASQGLGSGVPSPIVDGLIGSLDFDNDALLTLANGTISAARGADGLPGVAIQTTSEAQPSRVIVGGRYAARFQSELHQFLDWTDLITNSAELASPNGITCFSEAHTVAIVAQLHSVSNAALIDISQGAGTLAGTDANRSTLLAVPTKSSWTFRQGGFSIDVDDNVAPEAAKPQILIGRRSNNPVGLVSFARNHSPIIALANESTAAPPDSVTVGARKAFGGPPSLFLDGYIWRVLVFSRDISDAEIDVFANWATKFYGTAGHEQHS
jgi:hypothetical protein